MGDDKPNHVCRICGKKYYFCDTCRKLKTFQSWRKYADTTNCYKIYMVVMQYLGGELSREEAKSMLLSCDLTESETFFSWFKNDIKEILQ